ncbi:MAG: putative HTH-type transcriptional regulator YybR [Proteobacteria bacterium]|nr:putative HTH-type transcriptional regulator YybR [Pseudomonadota bacterium]
MPDDLHCAAKVTADVVGGRWKVEILHCLFKGTQRFSELQHAIDGVTQKVLTQQLRELEADHVISRQIFPEVPPRVEYSLTDFGRSLWPVLSAMHEWGLRHLAERNDPPTAPKAAGEP